MVFAKEKIESLNGSIQLEDVIVDLLDFRHYLNTDFNVDEVADFINQYLKVDGYEVEKNAYRYTVKYLNGGNGNLNKNIIFAAKGHKPEIVLTDTISYEIEVVKNKDNCLIFDRPIPKSGLNWKELINWWFNNIYSHPNQIQKLAGLNQKSTVLVNTKEEHKSPNEGALVYVYCFSAVLCHLLQKILYLKLFISTSLQDPTIHCEKSNR